MGSAIRWFLSVVELLTVQYIRIKNFTPELMLFQTTLILFYSRRIMALCLFLFRQLKIRSNRQA